jgi:hypothetical protein
VSASASDNVGVTKVEFYRDSGTLLGSDTSSPYSVSFNTTTAANGSHTLYAKAYDAAGNVQTSTSISVSVSNSTSDTTAPVVSLTSPSSGTTVSGTIAVSASASDNVGIAKVEFYRSTTLIASDTTSPYSISFDTTTVANGSLSLSAKGYDAAGNTTSDSTTVNVNNVLTSDGDDYVLLEGGVGSDVGQSSAMDSSGNVFVGAYFNGSANFSGTELNGKGKMDMVVAKYNSTGQLLWVNTFGGSGNDWVEAIAVDPATGDVVMTGVFEGTITVASTSYTSGGSYDILLVKLSGSSGAVMWSQKIGGTGDDRGFDVAVGPNGEVAMVGQYGGTIYFGSSALRTTMGSIDSLIVKYDAHGNVQWFRNFYCVSTDSAGAVAVDSQGSVLVTGGFMSSIDFGDGLGLQVAPTSSREIYVAKLSAAGVCTWSRIFGGTGTDFGAGVVADSKGDIIITGSYGLGDINFGGTTLPYMGSDINLYLVKLSGSQGSHVWSKHFSHTTAAQQLANAIAIDDSDNVLVCGSFQQSSSFGAYTLVSSGGWDGFVAAFSGQGAALWAKQIGGTGLDEAKGVSARLGRVALTGGTSGGTFEGVTLSTVGYSDVFLTTFTP